MERELIDVYNWTGVKMIYKKREWDESPVQL
jgi:hypothetical protein